MPSHGTPGPRRGFTLPELAVTVTIAGLLLTLAAPRFTALRDGHAVRSAMTELGASFSLAREEALHRRTPVAIVLDTAAGIVQLRTSSGSIRRTTLKASYGIRLGSNRDSAVYDPRGIGFGLSNLTVTVRRGGFVDTLTMSRLGRIRW